MWKKYLLHLKYIKKQEMNTCVVEQRSDSPSTILLKSSSEWQSLILSLYRPPPGAAALQTNNLPQTPSSTRGEKRK